MASVMDIGAAGPAGASQSDRGQPAPGTQGSPGRQVPNRTADALCLTLAPDADPRAPAVSSAARRWQYPLSIGIMALAAALVAGELTAGDVPESDAAIPRLRVVAYNVFNYRDRSLPQMRSPESRDTVLKVLAAVAADIAVLTETGGDAAMAEIRDELAARGQTYGFAAAVPGFDRERRIGILARNAPVHSAHVADATYRLRDRDVPVQRGFGHCVFEAPGGYRLHLVAAHLKSKAFDSLGQTDMRRYEARLLRYLVDDILRAEPEANILLVGDLNDTPESSPISTLCNRRSNPPKQLYDLRPVDRFGLCWTHCWEEADTYSRIDYAMASYHLLPEVDLGATEIPFFPEWALASDHRPLLVTLVLRDQPVSPDLLARFERNVRLPESPQSSFHEGRVVGSRKAQRN